MASFGSDYQGLVHHYLYNVDNSHCYGNRMFSEYHRLYSYGHHYLMALRGELSDGQNWIIVNYNSYSQTTTKQADILQRAIPKWWKVWNFDPEYHLKLRAIIDDYFRRIKVLVDKAQRARTRREEYLSEANTLLSELQEYFSTFKGHFDLRRLTKSDKAILAAESVEDIDILGIIKLQNVEAKRQQKAAERKRLERVKKELELIEEWKEGEKDRIYLSHHQEDFLRVYDGKVQTTQGIDLTFGQAKAIFKIWDKSPDSLKGQKVETLSNNTYIVKECTPSKLVIGCHTIKIEEAKQLIDKIS